MQMTCGLWRMCLTLNLKMNTFLGGTGTLPKVCGTGCQGQRKMNFGLMGWIEMQLPI